MAAVPTTLTLEQFRQLDLGQKPHLEFWCGEMFRKPMGTFLHGVLQCVLIQLFAKQGLAVLPEVRVRLGGEVELVPDLILTEHPPASRYPTQAFELAVEIRSPEQSLPWLTKKARYYIEQGVRFVWVIDPEARTAWMFSQAKPHGTWVSMDDNLIASTIELPLQVIFAEVDRISPRGED